MNQGNRPGYSNRVTAGPRRSADRYTPDTYRQAVQQSCRRVAMAAWRAMHDDRKPAADDAEWIAFRKARTWTPHQLRHSAARDISRDFGLEAARVVLGHQTLRVTDLYAGIDMALPRRVVEAVG